MGLRLLRLGLLALATLPAHRVDSVAVASSIVSPSSQQLAPCGGVVQLRVRYPSTRRGVVPLPLAFGVFLALKSQPSMDALTLAAPPSLDPLPVVTGLRPHHRVLAVVVVATRAVGSFGHMPSRYERRVTTKGIDPVGYRLQVRRVDARRITAEVVNREANRNRANQALVHESVGELVDLLPRRRVSANVVAAVASTVAESDPLPAPGDPDLDHGLSSEWKAKDTGVDVHGSDPIALGQLANSEFNDGGLGESEFLRHSTNQSQALGAQAITDSNLGHAVNVSRNATRDK